MSGQLPQMISRSSILSGFEGQENGSCKWFDLGQCFQEHLSEALDKLPYLEDEIWGKLMLMERNYRVAKAYLRQSVITVNGSDREFDGVTITRVHLFRQGRSKITDGRVKTKRLGIKAFSRFAKSEVHHETKVGAGLRLKIEVHGDILTKKFCKSPVAAYCATLSSSNDSRYVEGRSDFTKIRLPDESRAVKVFDMRKFKMYLEDEMRRPEGPDMRRLLMRNIVAFCLVKESGQMLSAPCWFFVINLISLDMIRLRLQAMGPMNLSPCSPQKTMTLDLGQTLGRNTASVTDIRHDYNGNNQSDRWKTTKNPGGDHGDPGTRGSWNCYSPDFSFSEEGTLPRRTVAEVHNYQPRSTSILQPASMHQSPDQTHLDAASRPGGSSRSFSSQPNELLKRNLYNRYSPSFSDTISSSTGSLKNSSGSLNELYLPLSRIHLPYLDEVSLAPDTCTDVETNYMDRGWIRTDSFALKMPENGGMIVNDGHPADCGYSQTSNTISRSKQQQREDLLAELESLTGRLRHNDEDEASSSSSSDVGAGTTVIHLDP